MEARLRNTGCWSGVGGSGFSFSFYSERHAATGTIHFQGMMGIELTTGGGLHLMQVQSSFLLRPCPDLPNLEGSRLLALEKSHPVIHTFDVVSQSTSVERTGPGS